MIRNNSLLVMTSLSTKITAQVTAGNFPLRTIERRAIITLHQQDIPVGTIVWFLGRHPATIVRWRDRFAQGHALDDQSRPGAEPKFDDTMKRQIFSFYTQMPPATWM